jgi:Na+-translocating ferredoxin:NAD+ oxidoreductase RNF subunit RnfB
MKDDKDVRMYPDQITPANPIVFNESVCNGCNNCVQLCVMDILMPNPEKGKPSIILYPDECWYDSICVKHCPRWHEGAISLNHPVYRRVRWKRKSTGEHFRVGMQNPPEPNDRTPAGGWHAASKRNEKENA